MLRPGPIDHPRQLLRAGRQPPRLLPPGHSSDSKSSQYPPCPCPTPGTSVQDESLTLACQQSRKRVKNGKVVMMGSGPNGCSACFAGAGLPGTDIALLPEDGNRKAGKARRDDSMSKAPVLQTQGPKSEQCDSGPMPGVTERL